MIFRILSSRLKELAGPFPVVFLTGPRQSGKTTLARATFPQFHYISLEDMQNREEAVEDPRGFLLSLMAWINTCSSPMTLEECLYTRDGKPTGARTTQYVRGGHVPEQAYGQESWGMDCGQRCLEGGRSYHE
jgi:hypothetical protein